jgi:glycosyltransferase involved in cell wall biosynthesis
MKIIIVHNKYQQTGGEEAVFAAEAALLKSRGNNVETVIFDNATIKTTTSKTKLAFALAYNFKSAAVLRNRIRHFQPDIIHVHNFFPLASPSIFFAAKSMNVPVVVTLHNYRLLCPSNSLYYNRRIYEKSVHALFPFDAIWKGVYRNSRFQTAALAMVMRLHNLMGTWRNKVDKFIVLTDFASRKFQNSHLRTLSHQFFVKPKFVEDFGTGNPQRKNSFLFIGRLCEQKGIEVLLKAASSYSFNLNIIGDGPLRSLVNEYASNNSNIRALGFMSRAMIIDELKDCTALIFPSNSYEGSPITILEAFSTGTPVITSLLGGLSEMVEENLNGLHFQVGDHNDLIKKVKEIQEPGVAARLGRYARKTYEERYTPEDSYQMLMSIYQQTINTQQSAKTFQTKNVGNTIPDFGYKPLLGT